jgi:superkiller protein 3
MVLMRQQQLEEALGIFRRVAAAEPASAQAHLNLGIALSDSERQDDALQSFDEAVRLSPAMAQAHLSRGRALYDLKRYEEAKAELETARRLAPGDTQALYRLGLVEARLNQPARAAELLTKFLAADPKNGTAHQELGQALLELGREEEGVAHLRTALKLDPANSQAAYALLRALSARGSNEASQLGQRVRELKKEELSVTQARALSNFALDAAKEKQWAKAVEGMRKAVETCGACAIQAALRRNLGLILAQSGDIAGATAELQTARKLDPADKDVQYALEVLERMKAKP